MGTNVFQVQGARRLQLAHSSPEAAVVLLVLSWCDAARGRPVWGALGAASRPSAWSCSMQVVCRKRPEGASHSHSFANEPPTACRNRDTGASVDKLWHF